jgi:hypothetical protein
VMGLRTAVQFFQHDEGCEPSWSEIHVQPEYFYYDALCTSQSGE